MITNKEQVELYAHHLYKNSSFLSFYPFDYQLKRKILVISFRLQFSFDKWNYGYYSMAVHLSELHRYYPGANLEQPLIDLEAEEEHQNDLRFPPNFCQILKLVLREERVVPMDNITRSATRRQGQLMHNIIKYSNSEFKKNYCIMNLVLITCMFEYLKTNEVMSHNHVMDVITDLAKCRLIDTCFYNLTYTISARKLGIEIKTPDYHLCVSTVRWRIYRVKKSNDLLYLLWNLHTKYQYEDDTFVTEVMRLERKYNNRARRD